MSRRAALEGFAHGLALALDNVRKLLEEPDANEWIDQTASPLGRRRHCALARRGVLKAHKDGARWLVRRKDLDAYIEGQDIGTAGNEAAEEAAVMAYRSRPKGRRVRRA